MSKIKEKIEKAKARKNSAPKPIIKNEQEQPTTDTNGLPIGLLVSLVLFAFFGIKYGTKRE